jgi:hypothetical protein
MSEPTARGASVLVVKRGPNAGSQFRLDRAVLSAGRHPASDIFLDDITVSRRHADSAVLASGDEIQIGNFRLVFVAGPGL